MAKEKTVKLEVKSNIEDVAKGFEKTDKAIKDTEKSLKDLNKEAEKSEKSFKRAHDTAQKSTRKTQKETDKLSENLKQARAGLDGVSSGFATAEGAMSLFGEESETVGVAMEKLREGMNIARGIEGFRKGKEVIKEMGVQAKVAAFGQKLLSLAVGTTSGALKIFRLALISTGIGAIVVGIGLLIANFEKISKLLDQGVVKGFKKAGVGIKILMVAFAPLIAIIKGVQKGLELIGLTSEDNSEQQKKQAEWAEAEAKREDERIQARLDSMKQEYDAKSKLYDQEIELAKLRGEDTEAMERKKYEDKIKNLLDLQAQEKKDFEDRAGYQRDFNEQQIKDKKAAIEVLKKLESEHYSHSVELTHEEEKLLRDAGVSKTDHVHSVLQEIEYKEKQHTEFMEKNTNKYLKTTNDMVKSARNELSIWEANKDKEDLAEKRRKWKAWNSERISMRRKIQDLEIDLMEDGIQKELEQNRVKFEREKEDIKGTTKEKKRLNDLYTEQQQQSEAEIKEKYRKKDLENVQKFFDAVGQMWEVYDEGRDEENEKRLEKQEAIYDLEMELAEDNVEKEVQLLINSYDEKFALAEGNAELTAQLEADMYAKIDELRKKDKDEAKKDAHDLQMAKAQIALDGLRLISDVAQSFAGDDEKRQKKAFQIKKVADIASATMDGYKAVLSTYANTPGGLVLKTVAATIAGAFSALQIANIARAQFEGADASGLSGAGSGAVGGDVVTPEFNIVADSGVNDLEGLGQPPIQAYVTSQDVTTAQGLDRARVENATI